MASQPTIKVLLVSESRGESGCPTNPFTVSENQPSLSGIIPKDKVGGVPHAAEANLALETHEDEQRSNAQVCIYPESLIAGSQLKSLIFPDLATPTL